jgi:hypothetical protein
MKLTKTQENFRKEMKNVNQKIDIYDTTRKGNPFYNYETETPEWKGILFGISSFIFLAFIIFKIYQYTKPSTSRQGNNITLQSNSDPSVTKNQTHTKGNVSKVDALILKQLQPIQSSLNSYSDKISEQNKLPYEKRNINDYRTVLLDSIVDCDKEEHVLPSINTSTNFEPLISNLNESITNSRYAYKYYLDYTNTMNPSDIELGNKYLSLANQDKQNYLPTLIDIFNKDDYNYSVQGNTINYTFEN